VSDTDSGHVAIHPDPDVELRKWALTTVIECAIARLDNSEETLLSEAAAVFAYIKDGTVPDSE
jgi:hypothetical protein